ncbi:MAG: cytochrome P450 [Erythrobacter sp.]|nr:cytochrome P450 [Erythrobacter sp.]
MVVEISGAIDDIDPSLHDRFSDGSAHEVFERLRREAPVHFCRDSTYGSFWSICSYDHILEVEANPTVFSSSHLNGGITIIDVKAEELAYLESFIMMDPPAHTRKRRAISAAFTPSEMERLTASIRKRTADKLDSLPIGEPFDWVSAVSIDLTIDMLAILFDFPWDERHKLRVWSDAISSLDMINNRRKERSAQLVEMAGRFFQLWQSRTESGPAPDLLSTMIHSEEFGQMTPHEFMGNMATLIVGGNDTTRNAMSGLVEAFSLWPEQWEKIAVDSSLIPNAASEVIRWHCPISHMRRTAMQDFELGGRTIRKGDKVVLWYLSANRDEAIFKDGSRFLVDRENAKRHLSFGYGVHRCVGARLAELQLQILLSELLERDFRIRVLNPPQRQAHPFLNAIDKLTVQIDRPA